MLIIVPKKICSLCKWTFNYRVSQLRCKFWGTPFLSQFWMYSFGIRLFGKRKVYLLWNLIVEFTIFLFGMLFNTSKSGVKICPFRSANFWQIWTKNIEVFNLIFLYFLFLNFLVTSQDNVKRIILSHFNGIWHNSWFWDGTILVEISVKIVEIWVNFRHQREYQGSELKKS